ncbi:MAG: DUF4956 domain-containing protein [Clostridiaceae bacterium]
MFESLLSTSTSTTISLTTVLLTIFIAFTVGIVISLTYMKTYPNGDYSQNFALTVILLPAVIAILIMLIGSDIARAFSLAGAFSIIRFRSEPGQPKDIAFVLFAMAAGLAAGMGVYVYAVLFAIVLCSFMLILNKTNFGAKKSLTKSLRITIPEDLNYETAFDDVFKKYVTLHTLKKVKTAALGSLYQLTYEIELLDTVSTKEFIDDLRCRNSNLDITLSLVTDKAPY